MKNLFKTLIMLTAVFALTGCLNSIDDSGFVPKKPNISFSEESLTIDQNGGELQVRLASNLPWRIKSDAAWCSISKDSGLEGTNLVLTVAKNRTRKTRVATISAWVMADKPVLPPYCNPYTAIHCQT